MRLYRWLWFVALTAYTEASSQTAVSAQDSLDVISEIQGTGGGERSILPLSGLGTVSPSWTAYTVAGSSLLRFPERDPSYILPLLPGITSLNGLLHVRGSRATATHYVLEGMTATNPLYGLPSVGLIPQAIRSVRVHTGPFGARLPSATGGMVETTMRTGTEEFEVSAEYRSDDFVKPGTSLLGTTPQGLKDFTITMGGALTNGLYYFLAGEYAYTRNDQSMFLEPFRFEGLTEDGLYGGTDNIGRLLVASNPDEAGVVEFKRNYLSKNWSERRALNANFSADLNALINIPLSLRLTTVFGRSQFPGEGQFQGSTGDWPASLGTYFRSADREMMNETKTAWVSASASVQLGAGAIFDFTAAYQRHTSELYDPDFGRQGFDDYLGYADSMAHADRGLRTDEWRDRYTGPFVQSTIYAFPFLHPSAPNTLYSKREQYALSFLARLSAAVSPSWKLEIGGSVDSWTMRSYEFRNIGGLLGYLDPNRDGDFSDSPPFASEYERRIRYIQAGRIDSYGFSYLGHETNGYTLPGSEAELDPPYSPLFASAYAELTYDHSEMNAAVGFRYEHFAPGFKDWTVRRLSNSTAGGAPWYRGIPFDPSGDLMGDESLIDESDVYSFILPRAYLNVPVRTLGAIYFAFGSYAALPALDPLFLSTREFTAASGDGPYTLTGRAVAFEVRPERSTQYELGARIEVSPRLMFFGSFYYKNIWDQLQIGQYVGIQGEPVFPSFQSIGNGSARGIELGLDLLRSRGLALSLSYAYSSANGLSSDPLTTLPMVTDDPPSGISYDIARPYDYEVRHAATGIIDYRSGDEASPVFRDVSVTGVVTYQSGHPYTAEYPYTPGWGLATPWTIGVWSSVDARMFSPSEPRNSSRTPSALNVDVRMAKGFSLGHLSIEVSFVLLNALNTKQVFNVYPTTGSATTDGWLGSDRMPPYLNVPLYNEFYQAINSNNRWAYTGATGNDLYGSPRQFRLGMTVVFGNNP